MDEQDVRRLVREIVARRDSSAPATIPPMQAAPRELLAHASHGRFSVLSGDEQDEGACLIEPAVRCNHCGYCQSLGH